MNDKVKELTDKVPELVKENKGALIGAVIGYLLTDSKEAQSAILGALAGKVLVDESKEEK